MTHWVKRTKTKTRTAWALAFSLLFGALQTALAASPLASEVVPSTSLAAAPGSSALASDAATMAGEPLPAQLKEARRQLAEVLDLRDRSSTTREDHHDEDYAHDKQRLLDWLVDLQRDKVKRIEELIAQQNPAAVPADQNALFGAFAGGPPYSALRVDALRDEIDGLKEKLKAAEGAMRANQTELQNLHDQLKARDAALRQAGERALGASPDAAPASAADKLDVLTLLKRIAEVEIAVTVLDQERLSLQLAAWRKGIAEMQAMVAKVLPDQHLSADDLAIQRQRLRADGEKLAAEIENVAKRYERNRSERDRLTAVDGATAKTPGESAAVLDVSLKTDLANLKGLEHLQLLNNLTGDAWAKRYAVMSEADAAQRRAAQVALGDLVRKLADWRSQSVIRQGALQTEIRAQRVRVDHPQGDGREEAREKEVLNLLLKQTAIDERVELAALRLEKQVSRWLADFGDPGRQDLRGRVAWLSERAATALQAIWQQELFVAEDASDVDGHKVSVKYGITVGKCVSIVVVFFLGYWLLARLSRAIQRQLVRRFKVSNHLASVIRRWSMIALSLALVVILLNLARIPLSVFAFLGGALAIGVGFGAQTIIKNFISGLILLFERKIRIGDVVELGGMTGHVTAVDLRATTVHGFNGVEAHIPNAAFIESQVVNWTYSSLKIRRELHVDVAYGTNTRQAEILFLAAAAGHPCVLREPAPEVFLDGFGENALKITLVYWVEFENPLSPRRVDSDLRHEIYGRLAQEGIHIPFPQRVVHVNLGQGAPSHPATPEPVHEQ